MDDAQLKGRYIYCSIKNDKGEKVGRHIPASSCQKRSTGTTPNQPGADSYWERDGCPGCTEWIDQIEEKFNRRPSEDLF